MSVPSGAGALVGSVRDLARWAEALHGGKVFSAGELCADDRAHRRCPAVDDTLCLRLQTRRCARRSGHRARRRHFRRIDRQPLYPRAAPVRRGVHQHRRAASSAERRRATPRGTRRWADRIPISSRRPSTRRRSSRCSGSTATPTTAPTSRFTAATAGISCASRSAPSSGARGRQRPLLLDPNNLTWFALRRGTAGRIGARDASGRPGAGRSAMASIGAIPPPPVVERAVLERYAGRYALNGTIATIAVTDDGGLTSALDRPAAGRLAHGCANEFAADTIRRAHLVRRRGPAGQRDQGPVSTRRKSVGERLPD